MALEITKSNLDVVISEGVTLIDFWAPWCPPCRAIGSTIDALHEEYAGDESVSIGKVNVDVEKELAAKFSVRTIPTIIVFKDGEMVATIRGIQTKEKFKELIENAKG